MSSEIEFKLSIVPEHAVDFWRALSSRYGGLKPSTQTLFSAYYDTAGGHLRKNGVALRLRRQDGRWIQTVKNTGSAHGGLHQRNEHETEVAAQLPSFPAMLDAGIGELIGEREVRESLDVIFTTEFDRAAVLLEPVPGTAIEVALDQGVIAAGQRRDPICEIELELKAGDADALFDLARLIAELLPVHADNRSKAERGYALAADTRPAPVKAGPAVLKPGMAAAEAFVAQAFDCLAHFQANERGVMAGRDPEYRHQARVALRRLRSLFRTFAPIVPEAPFTALLDKVKLLAGRIGEARNLDVFLDETLKTAGNGTHPGMAALKRRAQVARRGAARDAAAAISDHGHTRLMLDLTSTLMNLARISGPEQQQAASLPLREFAKQALSRQHAKVKKRGREIGKLTFEDLHRLRIAIKHLRYSLEFFMPLAEKEAQDTLEILSGLQGTLGHLNDGATSWKLLDTLAVKDPAAEFQQAVGFVRGWIARDGEQRRSGLEDAWKGFGRMDRWWK